MGSSAPSSTRRGIGLGLGPVLALLTYWVIPSADLVATGEITTGLPQSGRAVAAVGVLMAVLWITEAIPIAATALLPIALFPVLTGNVVTVKSAAAPYAHDLIFLFMGGFLLALTMQQWGLHRRIALHTIRIVGTRPVALVGGFMAAAAFLSMWVSNTATVVMMLPIATSVIELVRRELDRTGAPNRPRTGEPFPFALCLLLGTAYGASIGGLGTLIGTPPNALLAAFLAAEYDMEISFVRWMAIGLPLAATFLPLAWLLLTKVVFPIRIRQLPGGREWIRREWASLGAVSRGERLTAVIFVLTAIAWMTRPLLVKVVLPGGVKPLAGLTDAGIGMMAGILVLAIPVRIRRGEFLLTWEQARQLPWGILILFGGGLSLAAAMDTTGVAAYIGHGVRSFQGLPVPVLVLGVVAIAVFLTHLMSNTATTATLLPILAAVAAGLGVSPLLLLIPMTLAATCAFMLPIATPPNAIVFASGEITIPQMCKAGLWLNLIGVSLIMVLMYLVVVPVLAIDLP